jgi:hypothetical protein
VSRYQESGSRTWNALVQQSGEAVLGWPLAVSVRGRWTGNINLVTVARTRPDQSAVKQASRPFRYSKGFQIQCWMH